MLSAEELAQLRAMQAEAMPETVAIHRKTLVDDGHGGFTETDTVVATVSGRISSPGRTPEERMLAAQMGASQVYTISLPAGTDAQTGDVLIVTTQNNRTFTVISPQFRSYETARRVICLEKS